jgi:hypothetical protein
MLIINILENVIPHKVIIFEFINKKKKEEEKNANQK